MLVIENEDCPSTEDPALNQVIEDIKNQKKI